MTEVISPKTSVSALLAQTMRAEMERDSKIILLGEDIGVMGGVFNATRGLLDQFGEWRVRDTPISEMSFIGMGVGLAMAGYRPVVELMFADFVGVSLEQIVNAMAKIPYMSGGRVKIPMVIRTAGGSIGSAAQHSQCLWGMFAYWPGLKVVAPSCPVDYHGLLQTAIRSDDPVIFIEHKSQLNRRSDLFQRPDIGNIGDAIPFGKASVVRAGGDLTIVSISAAVEWSLTAAEQLAASGIDAEVIDLRTLVPLDIDTVSASVRKTGRLLVVDEDFQSFSMSGEIVARLAERDIHTKFKRLCMPPIPLPAAKSLEDAVMPTAEKIVAVATAICDG